MMLPVAAFVVQGAGCASASPPSRSSAPDSPPLHIGPPTDYVASASLEWMIVADLEALRERPGVGESLEVLFPPERLAAYSSATGLDLRSAGTGVVAKYPLSTLYLVETREGRAVEARFAEGLDEPPLVRSPHPKIRSLLGVRAGYPRLLVSVRDHFIAVSVGDPTSARIVELYALGKIRSAPALEGAALGALPDDAHAAPLRLYAAGPFEGAWARGARGLLGGATALAGGVRPTNGTLELRVLLVGTWDPFEDVPRAAGAWDDFAQSAFGALIGTTDLAVPARVEVRQDLLELTLGVRTRPLIHGIRAAVAAELEEILEWGPARRLPRETDPRPDNG